MENRSILWWSTGGLKGIFVYTSTERGQIFGDDLEDEGWCNLI